MYVKDARMHLNLYLKSWTKQQLAANVIKSNFLKKAYFQTIFGAAYAYDVAYRLRLNFSFNFYLKSQKSNKQAIWYLIKSNLPKHAYIFGTVDAYGVFYRFYYWCERFRMHLIFLNFIWVFIRCLGKINKQLTWLKVIFKNMLTYEPLLRQPMFTIFV